MDYKRHPKSCAGGSPAPLYPPSPASGARSGFFIRGAGSGGSDGGTAAPVTGVAAPLGGEEIDFNLLYVQNITPEPLIKNWGNIILILMIVAVAGVFFVTAWSFEGWGKVVAGWINDNVNPVSEAVAEANAATAEPESQTGPVPTSPELAALFERKPKLAAGNSVMLKDLVQILSDEKHGARMLHAVSRLDFKLALALKQVDKSDRELLLALVKNRHGRAGPRIFRRKIHHPHRAQPAGCRLQLRNAGLGGGHQPGREAGGAGPALH
ncbi:MAG: hypothetical protein ACE5G8_09070 [Anaerolineae bacterium]